MSITLKCSHNQTKTITNHLDLAVYRLTALYEDMKAANMKVYEILLSELKEDDLTTPVGELTKEQLDHLVVDGKAVMYSTLGEFQAAFNDEGVSDLNYIRFVSDDDEVNIYL